MAGATTIKDIARIAQLDISTVSRALNGSNRVNAATRERVAAVAARLGYHKNEIAQSLVTRSSRIIGLIVPDISNPFFAEVTKGVGSVGGHNGYDIILCDSNWDAEREREQIKVLRRKRVAGIIIHFAQEVQPAYARELLSMDLPLVEMGNCSPHDGFYHVSIDNVVAAHAATAYLVSLGHRRIAHVTGDMSGMQRNYRILLDRISGYRQALEEAGIPFDEKLVINTLPGVQDAYMNIAPFLRQDRSVTALFAASDVMALGAYRAIYEAGLRIPEDISVVGFDNIEVAGILRPALTTFEQPRFDLGQAAGDMLVRLINEDAPKAPGLLLRSRGLIVRESCAQR